MTRMTSYIYYQCEKAKDGGRLLAPGCPFESLLKRALHSPILYKSRGQPDPLTGSRNLSDISSANAHHPLLSCLWIECTRMFRGGTRHIGDAFNRRRLVASLTKRRNERSGSTEPMHAYDGRPGALDAPCEQVLSHAAGAHAPSVALTKMPMLR